MQRIWLQTSRYLHSMEWFTFFIIVLCLIIWCSEKSVMHFLEAVLHFFERREFQCYTNWFLTKSSSVYLYFYQNLWVCLPFYATVQLAIRFLWVPRFLFSPACHQWRYLAQLGLSEWSIWKILQCENVKCCRICCLWKKSLDIRTCTIAIPYPPVT